jgi:hypothetical protein
MFSHAVRMFACSFSHMQFTCLVMQFTFTCLVMQFTCLVMQFACSFSHAVRTLSRVDFSTSSHIGV